MKNLRLLILLVAALAAVPVLAADDQKAEKPLDKVTYVEATLPNVSEVLFRKGILRTDDPAAIEEYIRIHHCGLYEQYTFNDFAWSRIRESQARELEMRLQSLPEGLEIVSTLGLDKYDLANNEFTLRADQVMNNVGIINVLKEYGGSFSPCKGDTANPFVPRVHPLDLDVRLNNPITLKSIPMGRQTADTLINVMDKRIAHSQELKRIVSMVLRVRIQGIDPLSGVTDPMRRTVRGELRDIRIYEGPERKMLLYKKDYTKPEG